MSKSLAMLKNRKIRLDLARKHLKKLALVWNKVFWTDETKINFYQNDGKRRVWRKKGIANDPHHSIQISSVQYYLYSALS